MRTLAPIIMDIVFGCADECLIIYYIIVLYPLGFIIDYPIQLISTKFNLTLDLVTLTSIHLIFFVLIGSSIGFLVDKRNSWKKRAAFFLILFLVFGALGGYSNYLKYRDNKIIKDKFLSVKNTWRTSTSIEDCDKISILNPARKNDCIFFVVKQIGDASFCEKIINIRARSKEEMMEDCIFEAAVSSQDYDLCFNLSVKELKERCISKIAVKQRDLEKCLLIEDDSSVYYLDCIESICDEEWDSKCCRHYGRCKMPRISVSKK